MNSLYLPTDRDEVTLKAGERSVHVTNLRKPFWKTLQLTKGDLIQYYADISRWLLPHVYDRPMVMKRYPDGADGRTLASVYSVRPTPLATVSAPVSWKELQRGVRIE